MGGPEGRPGIVMLIPLTQKSCNCTACFTCKLIAMTTAEMSVSTAYRPPPATQATALGGAQEAHAHAYARSMSSVGESPSDCTRNSRSGQCKHRTATCDQ